MPDSPIEIPGWDERFETAQSRRATAITWTPLRHNFAATLRMQTPEVAASMVQIVLLAATFPKRGKLHDGGRDLTADDIARYVGARSEVVAAALSALGVRSEPATTRRKEGGKEGRKEVSTSVGTEVSPPLASRSADVEAVVAHYRNFHPRSRPGDVERRKIAARLVDGFTVADLQAAIDGCHRSPHNLGVNDRGRKFLSLELIVRNATKVQQFIETPEHPDFRTGREMRDDIQRKINSDAFVAMPDIDTNSRPRRIT